MSSIASATPRVNVAAVATAALLFAALVLLLDGPVWLVNLVPTQDGPVHLAQSDLIARFGWGGALAEPAASFYQWNPRIEPNFAIYAVIAGLIRLTGDALLANSLFLTLYGLVWVVAAFAIAHTESKRPTLAVLLLLPLAFGRFIHLGFYNYALGVPLFLLFAVFRRRLAGRHDVGALIATAVFLLALCMTHVTAAVVACLLLAAEGLTRAIGALQRSGPRVAARTFVIDGAWALAAALPTLLLVGSFLIAYRDIPGELPGRLQLIPRLVGASYLFSFTWWEVVALAPLLGAVVIAGIATLRRFRSLDLLWPVFLILILALSALNLGTGMASLSERLAPFTWIALVLMIARAPLNAALVRALGVAALIGLAGQTAIRAIAYKSWAPALDSVYAAGRGHPGATFVNVDLTVLQNTGFSWRLRPMLHANQMAALAAHGAGLSSALPSKRYFGYFPLQYVEASDFMRAMPDWSLEQDAQSLSSFRNANRGAPQVLIVTAPDAGGLNLANTIGFGDCKTSHIDARWLAVCTPQSR
ncbi:MAG TPA: hypothetical protein VN362_04485 [Xanthobacteraceae bacterium]|nr:hypothetical protein [Xanthobacteraceae bacterium]